MSEQDRRAISQVRIQNAERCLTSSKLLLKAGDYKSAANRSYYAIFYAIRALLALEGKDFKKHSAVLSYFRKEYIKKGLFDKSFSSVLSSLFEIRTDSDYDDFYFISKDETEEQIKNAEKMLEEIKQYLASQFE